MPSKEYHIPKNMDLTTRPGVRSKHSKNTHTEYRIALSRFIVLYIRVCIFNSTLIKNNYFPSKCWYFPSPTFISYSLQLDLHFCISHRFTCISFEILTIFSILDNVYFVLVLFCFVHSFSTISSKFLVYTKLCSSILPTKINYFLSSQFLFVTGSFDVNSTKQHVHVELKTRAVNVRELLGVRNQNMKKKVIIF